MEETPHRRLLQQLLPPSSAAASPPLDDESPDTVVIVFRLSLVAFIGIVSLWANHEASQGYAITIVNDSSHTFFGNRFQLFYISNDEATRTVIKASRVIENFLFPNSDNSLKKKTIKSVTLRLVRRNLTNEDVTVEMGYDEDQYVLNLNPWIMGGANFRGDVDSAIRRGVARIWLWDGVGNAPKNLVEGLVEYLVSNSSDSSTLLSSRDAARVSEPTACWDSGNPRVVAEFLNCGERRRPGFVRRLNYAMKDAWDDEKLGGALDLPVHELCESLSYNFSSV